MPIRFTLGAALLLIGGICAADSITVNGVTYEDVYIRESASRYYVQIPAEGRVISFAKAAVNPEDVVIIGDTLQREQLRLEWLERHAERHETALGREGVADNLSVQADSKAQVENRTNPRGFRDRTQVRARNQALNNGGRRVYVGDGTVGRVSLKNVTLGQALNPLLRSSNLDYSVEDGFIWISTPRRIRTESFEELENRSYGLEGAGMVDTLPKIVLRGRVAGRGGYGVGGGYGGRSGGYGGYGGGYGGYGGMGGGYGGRGGGYGGRGGGYGGMGGGMGGMGGGYGGMGGGFGGMGGGFGGYAVVPHFSSLVDLFTTIDDRLVGEPLAVIDVIGSGGLLRSRAPRAPRGTVQAGR